MIGQIRKRTEPEDIAYSLYLYSFGLSLRNTSKAICRFVKRSHTAIRDWIQKYTPKILCSKTIYILLNLSLMKPKLRLVLNIFGHGLLLKITTDKSFN